MLSLGFYLMRVCFCYDYFCFRYRVLVVNDVCCLIFIIVLSSRSTINHVHRPYSVALLYLIGSLLNDVNVFESFLPLHHLLAN